MKRLLTTLGLACACLSASAQAGDPGYPSPPAATTVASAELVLDADAGAGSGTPVAFAPGTDITTTNSVTTTSLIPGIHKLFLRSRSSSGAWSLTLLREFLVDYNPGYATPTPAIIDVVGAEYFIDTDPGKGAGTPIALTPGTDISTLVVPVVTTGLPVGLHRVFVRTQNAAGLWSVPEGREFAVAQDYAYPPAAPQTLSPVVRAEYFIDTDPGYGEGIAIPLAAGTDVAGVTAAVNTAGLSLGLHYVGVRTQDAAGQWTATSVHELLITDDFAYPAAPPAPGAVIAAEYFIDTDPGFGEATPISLTPGTDVANVSIVINTAGLSQGLHTLYIRSRQNPWSVTMAQSFSVSMPLSTSLIQFRAEERDGEAALTWKLSSEESLRHFEVERSAEGQSWTSVGRVDAVGLRNYSFADKAPPGGSSYYRLKMVDGSGGITYSGAERLYFGESAPALTLQPNPVGARFFVDGLTAGAQLEVLSMTGGRVARFAGTQSSAGYEVSTLPAGIYLVRISAPGVEMKTLQFVKQ